VNTKNQVVEEKPELVFADLNAGRAFRPLEYPITEELIRSYVEIVGDQSPLYRGESAPDAGRAGAPLAPPGLAAIYARASYLQDHTMPSGGVLAKQEFDFVSPAEVGDTLTVKAVVQDSTIDDKLRKRVTFLIEAKNQDGKPISTIRLYAIWPK
jgi:acyl dehydratase